MALQASGIISLADIHAEFGGPTPIKLSNYYRGGAYVPATTSEVTNTRQPASGENYNQTTYTWYCVAGPTNLTELRWGSTSNIKSGGTLSGDYLSYTKGTTTYYRGSLQQYRPQQAQIPPAWWYAVYRTITQTVNTNINTSIPTSGVLSLSNFYGGRAS